MANIWAVDGIGALVRFSRLVSAASADDVMAMLADSAVEQLGVEAAAVLAVGEGDAIGLAASRGLPDAMRGWILHADSLDEDVAAEVLASAGAPLAYVRSVPLVSNAGLHGLLVLLSARPIELDPERAALAAGLADLAAIASGKAADYAHLERSYGELRASRDAMARTEKLRSLGQMSAGIAHDLKNLLNPLALQLELLRRRISRGDKDGALKAIDQMNDAVRFGTETVERLRDFSRQAPEAEADAIDLAKVAASAIEITRPRLAQSPGVTVLEEIGAAPAVRARASDLANAVVNLVINAVDAMPGGGAITVRTGASDGGGWVEVADDGPGMPPEVERRVFEPFFTTKGEHGTGLGLAMVYAFVQRHGGRLTLDTAPGEGARFRLWFPAVA